MGRLGIGRLVTCSEKELAGFREVPDNSTLCNITVQATKVRLEAILEAIPEASEEAIEIMNDTVGKLNLLMLKNGTSLSEIFEKKRVDSINNMTAAESHSFQVSPF